MQWQELVSALADETKYTRREIRTILRALSALIRDNLEQGRDVHIWGLGKFLNVPSARRSGRHPVTGERITIPATRRVKFDPSEEVRASVKASADLFKEESLEQRFGLPRKRKKESKHGKVRSRDRPGEGTEGKEGGRGE